MVAAHRRCAMGKKIGVLGSGDVAKTLAGGFKKHGHDVKIGSREAAKLAEFSKSSGVATGTFAEVATFAEIVVLAVKGTAAKDVLKLAGEAALAGKILVDACNPIAEEPPNNGVVRFFTGPNDSLMERLQSAYPKARFVKAFNSVGNAFMVNPKFPGGPPSMFICGNDAAAKTEVTSILTQFGWDTQDMGMVESARAIEPLCQLWCVPGMLKNQWTHAFKLLKM
jgi:8-hydroxy-5-deazaflavin:NADPH oxidoreductase